MDLIFLTFIEVWTQWVPRKFNVTPESFAWDPFRLYFDECQENEIHLLYLYFIFTSFLFIMCGFAVNLVKQAP